MLNIRLYFYLDFQQLLFFKHFHTGRLMHVKYIWSKSHSLRFVNRVFSSCTLPQRAFPFQIVPVRKQNIWSFYKIRNGRCDETMDTILRQTNWFTNYSFHVSYILTTFFILHEYSKWKEVHWRFLSCVIVRLVIL